MDGSLTFPTGLALPTELWEALVREAEAAIELERTKLRGPAFLAQTLVGNLEELLRRESLLPTHPHLRWPLTYTDEAADQLAPRLEGLYDPRWDEGVFEGDPNPEELAAHVVALFEIRFE